MKKSVLLFSFLLVGILSGFSQFKNASFMVNGFSLPYQIMYPDNYDETKAYPLVVMLHGAGERGDDNHKQLTHGEDFLVDNFSSKYPAIVIVPQCPTTSYWANVTRHEIDGKMNLSFGFTDTPTLAMQTLMALIADWQSSGKVDINRFYVGGLSMGGMGTFELLWRMPRTFAAAFAICGGGDLSKLPIYAKHTAVWIFHGDADSVVPVQNSRNIYSRLKELGCDVEYTEYEGVNHGSWINAFQEKRLAGWLFDHRL